MGHPAPRLALLACLAASRPAPGYGLQREGAATAASSASAAGLRARGASLRSRASLASRTQADDSRGPRDAHWFGEFAEGESTYDEDVDRLAHGKNEGWSATRGQPDAGAAWYHESMSAGPRQAWQTHYPALSVGVAGEHVDVPSWRLDGKGDWVQDYQPPPPSGARKQDAPGVKTAGWFESSVGQFDGFGRPRPPLPGTGQMLAEGLLWRARSANTTLACAAPGCVANATLMAFDGAREVAGHCKLSLFFHPTDFDDQYSGERVTFIKVNGVTVSVDCFPMVSGCDAASQGPMFACVRDLPVDHIVSASGALQIEAGISEVVDECPYEGNLLSAVPMVTCLIAPETTTTTTTTTSTTTVTESTTTATTLPPDVFLQLPFRCPHRGCRARAAVEVNRSALPPTRCLLGVGINQTDFDGDQGTREQVDYVKINGAVVAENVKPGLNPCKAKWSGKPLTLAEIEYPLLTDYDVTGSLAAGDGPMLVEVKISDFVDECAHDGFLLTGHVKVHCTFGGRAPGTRPAEAAQAPAAAGAAAEPDRDAAAVAAGTGAASGGAP